MCRIADEAPAQVAACEQFKGWDPCYIRETLASTSSETIYFFTIKFLIKSEHTMSYDNKLIIIIMIILL